MDTIQTHSHSQRMSQNLGQTAAKRPSQEGDLTEPDTARDADQGGDATNAEVQADAIATADEPEVLEGQRKDTADKAKQGQRGRGFKGALL